MLDEELEIYSSEFLRSGLQGGLNWSGRTLSLQERRELSDYLGKSITVPVTYIAGGKDRAIHQVPGALKAMQKIACSNFQRVKLVKKAGHFVQQEKPYEAFEIIGKILATG